MLSAAVSGSLLCSWSTWGQRHPILAKRNQIPRGTPPPPTLAATALSGVNAAQWQRRD